MTISPEIKASLAPKAFCHIVLRTSPEKYQEIFIRFDYEHHRIGILKDDRIKNEKLSTSHTGLEHVAFGYDTLVDLAEAYKQRKARNLLPVWCVNHGTTTSMYYCDPDGNHLECEVDNFDTPEEAVAFMDGEHFHTNPIGVDYNPEELIKRLNAGEDERALKKRPLSKARQTIPDSML